MKPEIPLPPKKCLLKLPLIDLDKQTAPMSLSTRSDNQSDWLRRLVSPEVPSPGLITRPANTPRLGILDKSNSAANKSGPLSSFSAIFSRFVKANLKKQDESSCFDEDVLDLKKWGRMTSPRKPVDVKKDFAMRRMKSSTLIVKTNQKTKSSIPLALQQSRPVDHIYVRDASSNLATQKERTLVQFYAKTVRLQKKPGYSTEVVSKRRLAGLTK